MERKYIIPLRKEWLKVPIYKRTSRAVRATKHFLQKHMKVEDVRLGRNLNMALWTNGTRNPPHKIEVFVKKFETKEGDYVRAEVPGKKFEEEDKKVVEQKSKLQEKIESISGQKDTKVSAKRGEEKKEEKKKDKVKAEVLKQEPEKKEEKIPEVKTEKKEIEEKERAENLVQRSDKKVGIKK